jgi:hypothetical protein
MGKEYVPGFEAAHDQAVCHRRKTELCDPASPVNREAPPVEIAVKVPGSAKELVALVW